MNDSERALRELLDEDVEVLHAIVASQWSVAPDPFGSAMLVPVSAEDDPLPIDELPWPDVVRDFRRARGRPPRPGARVLAERRLTAQRVQGGRDG